MSMEICDLGKCTGCFACYSVCPVKAINMQQNEMGFYYPEIFLSKCIECFMCKETCPINRKEFNLMEEQEVYACWLKDDEIRINSTSGGAFTAIAKFIFAHEGIVFGARYDDSFQVVHASAQLEEDINYLRGSKYVQSFIGDTYLRVEEYLKRGVYVGFVGTPCQVDGLCSYLKKPYGNLITIDLVCHGVPSPGVYKEYINNIQKTYKDKIANIYFRYKKPGWHVFSMKIVFKSGKIYTKDLYHDPFLVGFLDELFLRPCCSVCKYTNLNRVADITLADFWGYIAPKAEYIDDDKGVSLVIINTPKGKKPFDDNLVRESMIIVEKPVSEALKGNRCLSKPYPKNRRYDEFWKDYPSMTFDKLRKKYLRPQYKKMLIYYSVKLYANLPYAIRKVIKKIVRTIKPLC